MKIVKRTDTSEAVNRVDLVPGVLYECVDGPHAGAVVFYRSTYVVSVTGSFLYGVGTAVMRGTQFRKLPPRSQVTIEQE